MNEAVVAELRRIYDENGLLTAEDVLAEAADEASPLHSHFTWDDDEAAEKWRLNEAQKLIRKVKINVAKSPDEAVKVRAYVSVNHDGRRGYMPTDTALEVHRDQVIQQAMQDLAALRRRYESLVDFDQILRSSLAQRAA